MTQGRLLIVEDDQDIASLLGFYFGNRAYQVVVAHKGTDALAQARHHPPDLVVLDIDLPDINGYEVCMALRQAALTRYVPIIFLTSKRERHAMIEGLELGADDYITKPFDIEELQLRIENSMKLAEGVRRINELSGFPTRSMLEQYLHRLFKAGTDWTYIDIHIQNFEEFSEIYGWSAANEIIRTLATIIREIVETDSTGTATADFMAHPLRDNFAIVTATTSTDEVCRELVDRFLVYTQPHYTYQDREQGYMTLQQGDTAYQVPLLSLITLTVNSVADAPENSSHLNAILTEKRRHCKRLNDKTNIIS